MEVVDFSDFMKTEIFPGGFLADHPDGAGARAACGFKPKRRQSLQRHYCPAIRGMTRGLLPRAAIFDQRLTTGA
jgi:cyclopropane-fatty-acyl-phospholipid synthase